MRRDPLSLLTYIILLQAAPTENNRLFQWCKKSDWNIFLKIGINVCLCWIQPFSQKGGGVRLREKEVFSEGKCRFLSSPPCSWVWPPLGFVWGWGLYSASFSIFLGKEDIKKKVPTIWMFVALMNTGIFAWIPSNNWHFPMCFISTLAKLLAWTNMWKMVNSTMLLEREQ